MAAVMCLLYPSTSLITTYNALLCARKIEPNVNSLFALHFAQAYTFNKLYDTYSGEHFFSLPLEGAKRNITRAPSNY